jgi:LacI family transcriptional regulator
MMVSGSRHITRHRNRERGFRAILNERHPSRSLVTVIETDEEAGRLVEIAFKVHLALKVGRLPGSGMSLAMDIEIFLPENA